uniref:Dihydrodiol dehydrogenase, tandem duplicate 1 n=1 Tax=Electrophorus electricus TaxID=8005 RepID=A0A4W4G873_ELEEL
MRTQICGAGKISHDFCMAMKTLPSGDHQITAVAARNLQRPKNIIYLGVLHTEHLFLNTERNVLCEKPFAMNLREGKQLTASRKNNIFLIQLLAEDVLHIPCSVEKELVGDALLDIGVYCLQFVLMKFKGEKPESVHATGMLLNSLSPQEYMSQWWWFLCNRVACAFSITVALPNDATISGTKGTIRISFLNGKQSQYPLPESSLPLYFTSSTALHYDTQEIKQSLLRGLKESRRMTLAGSLSMKGRGKWVAFDQDLLWPAVCSWPASPFSETYL